MNNFGFPVDVSIAPEGGNRSATRWRQNLGLEQPPSSTGIAILVATLVIAAGAIAWAVYKE